MLYGPPAVRITVWALVGLQALGAVLGFALGLFDSIPWYDDVGHFSGGYILTLALALLVYQRVLGGHETHPVMFVTVVTLAGLGVWALWEVVEWAYDLWAPGQLVSGQRDTMFDLIADTAGALLAAISALVIVSRTRRQAAEQRAAGEEAG